MKKDEAASLIKKYTNKEFVYFLPRANRAIKLALRFAKSKGLNKVVTADEGGWLTYIDYAKALKMELVLVKSDHGIIKKFNYDNAVLLLNIMPAYAYLYTAKELAKLYKDTQLHNSLMISDVTACLGLDVSTYGDIILGSFGKHKPIMLGRGGFIATNNIELKEFIRANSEEAELEFSELVRLLKNARDIHQNYYEINMRVKQDLKSFNIIHPTRRGINVVIKCNDADRDKIIKYCHKKGYEYTQTPRFIRTLSPGISIEIKRREIL